MKGMKDSIRNWVVENGVWYGHGPRSLVHYMESCFSEILPEMVSDLQPQWVSVESITLNEGDSWLCNLNGQLIVLELGYEAPTYEENFKPYFYWHEPCSDMLAIEWDEITSVYPLPEIEELSK